MARWNGRPNTQHVLEAADQWKQRSLLGDKCVFNDDLMWLPEHLASVRAAFNSTAASEYSSFIDRLAQQLAGCQPPVQRLAAEVIWVLLLTVSDAQMGPQTKRDRIERIYSLSGVSLPSSPLLGESHLAGVAKPGAAFMTKLPDEFDYALRVFLALKELPTIERGELLSGPWQFGAWLDSQGDSERRAFRHMLLWLCFADSYERIMSSRHKRQIQNKFAIHQPKPLDVPDGSLLSIDKSLLATRAFLMEQNKTSELDFYLPPVRDQWLASDAPDPDGELSEGRQYWIEKTIVKGRPDREQGAHALGQALWSPQRSKNGGDIYANMRRVAQGDVVFHLTDNSAITGVSIAANGVNNKFTGLSGTEWEGPAYRIQLGDFEVLDPPFDRDAFLNKEPYATELRELVESGAKGLFFNSKLELNQGAYLTKVTPTLLSILNRAYQEFSGKILPGVDTELHAISVDGKEDKHTYSLEDALGVLFLERKEIEDILLLWTSKKNVILQGPPGVGKSFAARKLAFALMGEENPDRIGFVQFHQSFSYDDFVEGFRPTATGFELRAGKFVEFCRRAEADPDFKYVFIIDEINRGNLSKILGELMLLVENDKRAPEWAIALASGKIPFYVPPNVFIMGLMNTADRSLAVVDYALRRRFAFVDLKPKIDAQRFRHELDQFGINSSVIDALVNRVGALNNEIVSDVANLGPGFAIGHSFFCAGPADGEDGPAWYARVIRTEVAPLLREYWFDAPSKAHSWEEQLLAPI